MLSAQDLYQEPPSWNKKFNYSSQHRNDTDNKEGYKCKAIFLFHWYQSNSCRCYSQVKKLRSLKRCSDVFDFVSDKAEFLLKLRFSLSQLQNVSTRSLSIQQWLCSDQVDDICVNGSWQLLLATSLYNADFPPPWTSSSHNSQLNNYTCFQNKFHFYNN